MTKKYLILYLALISCSGSKNQFSWSDVEKNVNERSKRDILETVNDKLVAGYIEMADETKNNDIFSLFHFFDLNRDGLDDIVFNGYGGAANEYVMVFTNSENGYVKKLHRYGHIESVSFKENVHLKIKSIEFVGDDSGDSLLTYRVLMDKLELVAATRIK